MKKILINVNPWQTRIAITRDNQLQNIYFYSHAVEPLERSFFKGTITKVLPGIQTAFVEIGQPKAGFLHISEIDRELAIEKMSHDAQLDEDAPAQPAPERPRQRADIKNIFHEGEEVLVQVSKEPVYEKGAKLSTCFTLPGRFIVLMPNIPRIGVSKKIAEREERIRLKELVRAALPEGMGGIIRTTAESRTATEISRDISFLLNTWETIQERFKQAKPAEKIYEDLDLKLQIVRDHLDDDVDDVIIDDKTEQQEIYAFVKKMAPEYAQRVKLYTKEMPLFQAYNLEKQIEATLDKKVELASGGSLIIESTEAMTVIDVNTGKFTGKGVMEETILKTNLEAAEESVRQLRLRNIGGLIVIDFIDMMQNSNKQKLFKFFEKTLRERDKFQSVVLKISEFGLIQMTRKRSGKTLVQQLTQDCSTCKGLGFIKTVRTQMYNVLREIKYALKAEKPTPALTIELNPEVFEMVSSVEYNSVLFLEKEFNCKVTLASRKDFDVTQYKILKR